MTPTDLELQRLNRAYRALGHCTAELVRAKSEPELLAALCKTLVDVGGYLLAWVGYAEGGGVRAVSASGAQGEQAYLDGLQLDLARPPLNEGPIATALRSAQPAVNRDTEHNPSYVVWKKRALEHGFRSSIALPLIAAGKPFGVLSVYAAVPDAFDDDERELLTRLADGLSFGIEALRTRQSLEVTRAELRSLSERSRFEILEQSPSAWIAIGRDWRFLYVNPKWGELSGRPVEALLGNSVWDAFPHYRGTAMDEAVTRAMETRAVVTLEQLSARGRWIEGTFYPIGAGVAGTFADVTERKRLEGDLRESELRFRQLAESMDDVFWLTEIASGKILYVNPAYERIWGRSRELLYASREEWLSTIHPADRDRVRASLSRQLAGDWEQEYRLVRPDGTARWIRDRCYQVRDQRGNPHRLAGTARDITEQRLLEEQLRQSQKMEAVGQLAGGIAHDFNNLLAVILNYAGFALDGAQAGRPNRGELEEIQRAGERAVELTRQLLAFGRKQMLQPRVLDLHPVLSDLEPMLGRLLGEHIELVLQLAPQLDRVYVDPSQVSQIVINLAVNARDAMPKGGRVLVETSNTTLLPAQLAGHPDVPPGPYVLLQVSDSGTGMDARTRERIFEPFFTTKEQGKGTGLGLSTVFGIVKQSKGHIAVESEPGKGSTFKIYLPRTDRLPSKPALRAVAASPGTLRGTETILLVEDDDQVRKLTHAILAQSGYRVLEAAHGSDGLQIAQEHQGKIALLLTDVVMPRMSGKELAERLAPLRPETRVLYVSGYDAGSIAQYVVLESGVAFLQKPVRPEVLLGKIRELLDLD